MGFTFDEMPTAVDVSAPLIYMWEIRDHSDEIIYRDVGRSIHGAKRARIDYSRNVANLRDGRSYRAGKPDGFRDVHRWLHRATLEGFSIRLYLLQNVGGGDIEAAKTLAKSLYLAKPFKSVAEG